SFWSSCLWLYSFYCARKHGVLPSFPTRRSSDLGRGPAAAQAHAGPGCGAARRGSGPRARRDNAADRARCRRARWAAPRATVAPRSEEHTSELQSRENLVCRLLLEKKNKQKILTQ